MSSVVISGDTSGSITLQAPAVSGSTVLTLPATTGNFLTSTTQLIGNGTTTNDNASTGQVGQYVSSSVSGISLNNSVANITTISLTAGDWDVRLVFSSGGASATCTAVLISMNTNSLDYGTQSVDYMWSAADVVNGLAGASFTKRVSLSATTTIYAISKTVAGTCTSSAFTLTARRVR